MGKFLFCILSGQKMIWIYFRILNSRGERPLTAYLIHSLPLQQSAVQVFAGEKMSVVGHLVGLEQIGYEKILGMTMTVSKPKCWARANRQILNSTVFLSRFNFRTFKLKIHSEYLICRTFFI